MKAVVLLCLSLVGTAYGGQCPESVSVTTSSNNPKFGGSCQVYKRGESPCTTDSTMLGESVGWITVVLIGPLFCGIAVLLTVYQFRALGLRQSSEMFNTAGRSLGPGLTASTIVSKWTWAASLLMSSNMGWTVGLSGPFWYLGTNQGFLFFPGGAPPRPDPPFEWAWRPPGSSSCDTRKNVFM